MTLSKPQPEVSRLRSLASKYRSRCVELEQLFTNYVGGAIKKLLAARAAKPSEYQKFDEKLKVARTRADLLATFVQFDTECKNAMTYDEFKSAMLLKGFLADEQAIQNTFRGMDKDHNEQISEREFLGGVIGKLHSEEFSFKSQIDELNSEVRKMELKSAEDSDYIEKIILENELLRSEYEDREANNAEEKDAEIERLKLLLQQVNDSQEAVMGGMKEEMDREISRLREFGTAMRNQLNLLQRETIVGARTATKKILGMSGATEEELDSFDRETEASQLIAQVRQVFINLDDHHLGDMDFDKFTQAYQWLSVNASMDHLQKTFARLDKGGRGLITEADFLNAVIQDMDVGQFTPKAQFDNLMENITQFDDRVSELLCQDVSQRLRDRMSQLKEDTNRRVKNLFSSMGIKVEDVLSPEVLNKHLDDAFDKFDTSRDQRLGFKEFGEAWRFLGLKGTQEELREAFDVVDTDKSGLIDRKEFKAAVRDNRLEELDLGLLLDRFGVELGSVQDRYAAFASTQARRRKQRKTMEATLAERCSDVVGLLCKLTGKPRDASKAEAQREMRETFDRFDRNGSGELNLDEYKKAWRFLGREGSDADITKAFQNVDIDNSGYIEWDEFVFSLQGEEAQKYGIIADIEIMLTLLSEVSSDILELRGERSDTQKQLFAMKDRLSTLQHEVTKRTDTLVQRMKRVSGHAGTIGVDDLDAQLRDAFAAADSNGTGYINVWQFTQAWMSLGLGGNEEDLKEYFKSVERLGGYNKGMDERQFIRVVKAERLAELSLRSRLSTLDYLFGKIEGGYSSGSSTDARRRLNRQKQDADIAKMAYEMIQMVLPATDDVLSNSYNAKKERYEALTSAFNRFDSPRTGILNFQQFRDARRFVGYTGTEADLKKQFASVDVDGSGGIDHYEFVQSDMGKKSNRVGAYGYNKILNKLLQTAVQRYKNGPHEVPRGNNAKAIRLNARKMVQRMTGFGGVDQRQLENLGIHVDRRAHSITAEMLAHVLHD